MAVDIGPKIGIDGEAEFRKQINNLTQQMKTFGSEMEVVTSQFGKNKDSMEALTAKNDVLNKSIDTQKKKLEELQKGLADAAREFGDTDTKTLKWKQAVNNATTQLNKMQSELQDNESAMENFGKEVDDVGDSIADAGNKASGFRDVLSANLISDTIIGSLKALGEGLKQAVEGSRETRKIMGSLEISSEAAGYSAEQTKDAYKELYGVLGDNQTAATTTANLQALGLEQEDLNRVIDGTIGAWAKYGDSIPIDGLAESINETVKVGQVTGTFADVLNWAGTSEDEFNEKLKSAATEADRANIVLEEMAKQGLMEAGDAWQKNNESLVEANQAIADHEDAVAQLGENVEPVFTTIQELVNNVVQALADMTEGVDWTGVQETIANIADAIGNFVTAIIDNKDVIISALAGIAAGFAAWNIIGIVQTVITSFQNMAAALQGVTTAQQLFNIVMGANPIAKVITLLVALGTALVVAYNTSDEFRAKVDAAFAAIRDVVLVVIDTVKNTVSAAWEWITTDTGGKLGVMQAYVNTIFQGIQTVISVVMTAIQGIIKAITQVISGDWSGAWNTIKETVTSIVDQIKSFISTAFDNILTGIKTTVGNISDAVKTGLGDAVDYVKELPGKFLTWGKDMIDNLVDGIKEGIGKVKEAISNIAETIRSYIHFTEPDVGPLSDFHTYMPDMTKTITSGIRAGIPDIQRAMNDMSSVMVPQLANGAVAGYDRLAAQMGNMQVVLEDGTLVGKLAPRINKSLGGIYTREKRFRS